MFFLESNINFVQSRMWNAVLYRGGGGGENARPENNITEIKEREIRQQITNKTIYMY